MTATRRRSMTLATHGAAWLLAGILPALAAAQDTPKPSEEKKDAETPKAATPTPSAARGPGGVKPYDKVITKDAKTSAGLFLVHRLEDKVFYEIPVSEFGKEMLWVTQIAQTGTGFGFGGSPVGDRVVRWEQRDDLVLLRDVRYEIRADVDDPIRDAVKASSVEPIIAVFNVQAYGKDKAPVIDVTSLLTGDVPEFSARGRLRASGIDSRRTFVEKVKAFPTNIEAKVLATYRLGGGGRRLEGLPIPVPSGPPDGGDAGVVTAMIAHSMVRLPDEPMKPRRFDDRVGFFNVEFKDFSGQSRPEAEDVAYITRWRLEKKDPKAEVSEPVKPIVFYVGREVPAKWRPWIKKGVEAWQPAFEKAGFKNAIVCKEPPSEREDPDWDAEDARYSVIRWLPATIENAMGPHVHDPRTGEILEADILMYHNVIKLVRDWYFVQASPSDEKSQKLPLSDDLLGELLSFVVTHEVGHSLGFPHNMKASSSYTVEQLRSKDFTAENGTAPSIMDYARFNYVAQPGDGAALMPKIGPYDHFAVEWGYKSFPDAKDYDAEKAELAKIAARQKDDVKLRFGDPNPGEDPTQQTEDLGSDAVAATELGMKNIDRVAGYLVEASCKDGENYDLLRNMYSALIAQRNRELNHVANVVGGVVRTNFWFPDGTKVYEPVPAEQQKKAVAFLIEHGLRVPEKLVDPAIVQRLEPTGSVDRILGSQRGLLASLLGGRRLKRMGELAARDGDKAYRPSDLIADLHAGIFSELKKSPVDVDLYRRNLQRAYVDVLSSAVENPASDSDQTALARAELKAIAQEAKSVLADDSKQVSPAARIHLDDLQARIEVALSPYPRPSSGGGRTVSLPFFPAAEGQHQPLGCWTDHDPFAPIED
jgi:hypothetical protein